MVGDPVPVGSIRRLLLALCSVAMVGLVAAALSVGLRVDGDDGEDDGVSPPGPASVPTTAPLAPSESTTAPAGPPVEPDGRLVVEPAAVTFADPASRAVLVLRNDGDGALRWTATPVGPFVAVAPSSGSLPPGATAQVGVVLDRLDAPEGPLVQVVAVDAGDAGAVQVPLQGLVARPPIAGNPAAAASTIVAAPCPGATSTAVSATVTDESGVASAVVRWRGSGAIGSGAAPMVVTGDRATGTLGPFLAPGEVTWYVVATDVLGATGESPREVVTVAAC